MPQTVDIPGVGSIDFPDNMPPEVMHGEVSKMLSGGGGGQSGGVGINNLSSPITAQQPPSSSLLPPAPTFLGAPLYDASKGVGGNLLDAINIPKAMGQGIAGFLNIPAGIHNIIYPNQQYAAPYSAQQPVLPDSVATVLTSNPLVDLLAKHGVPGMNSLQQVNQSVKENAQGLTTPEMIGLGPLAGTEGMIGKATQALFAGQMSQHLPETIQNVHDVKTGTDALLQTLMTLSPVIHGLTGGGQVAQPFNDLMEKISPGYKETNDKITQINKGGSPEAQAINERLEHPFSQLNTLPKQPLHSQANQQQDNKIKPFIQEESAVLPNKEKPLEDQKQEETNPLILVTINGKSVTEEELRNNLKPKTPAPGSSPAPSDVPTITSDYSASEKAAGRGGFVLETPRALMDKATSGFSPEARPDSQQLLGRLDNLGRAGKVSPSEVEYFKEQGLEEYLKTKPTVAEVGKWMQENGPKVEVKKFGEGIQTEQQKQAAKAEHLFDTLGYTLDRTESGQIVGIKKDGKRVVFHELPENAKQAFKEIDIASRTPEVNQAHWSFVAPKAEKDMPGYVEVAVTKPTKQGKSRADFIKEGKSKEEAQQLARSTFVEDKFPSSHNFPPNTLGFGRGYMETMPDGKKVFHVVEVQSDWAQAVRAHEQTFNPEQYETGSRAREIANQSIAAKQKQLQDPLLAHHENLVLKALISHAREQGADAIAVSDAETAMMSEGHDRLTSVDNLGVGGWNKTEPEQAKGMRLHYDQTLPRALEKLTGKKGERVDFGEHEKAFEQGFVRPRAESQEANDRGLYKRPDLIFRNPDGTPKTSVTARLYPLDAIKERNDQPFTVFGKRYAASDVAEKTSDVAKNSAANATPTSFADSRVTSNPQAKELGLRDGMTAHDVIQNIIKNPAYSDHYRTLAGFLSENFEPALRSVPVEQGDVNQFDMNRGQGVINLAAHEEYGHGGLAGIALHEAVHAATEWASEFPKTATQRAAVERLNGLLDKGVKQLPTQIGDYLKNHFRPLYDKVRFGKASQLDLYRSLDENNISSGWFPRLYSMTTRGEMLAQMFGDREVFDWLNREEDKGYVSKVWDGIKQLLGVKNGSIVDEALDTMRELGAERHADEWQPQSRLMDAVEGKLMPGAPGTPVGPERSTKEMIEANLSKLAGRSAPHTMQASAEVGNKLVRYASARIAAPQIGEAMASGVLKNKFRDAQFDKDLGRVMVQDRLNALRALHESKGDAELAAKVSNIMQESEFKTLLARKDIQAALERHKESVQTDLERMHRFLGGKMSVAGQETGAFVNLVALLNPDDVEAAKGFIYGSRKGDITNPLRRGSSFNQQAKGTAEAYEESYKAMVTRAYRGNYEEYAKQKLYEEYQKAGLGVEEKPGVKPPMFGGQPAAKVAVDRRGGRVSNLWVRRDLAPELRQALQTDSPVDKSGFAHLANLATELQVMGPTDFVFHMGNMLAALKWSQGSKSALMDVARKLPMVSIADTAGRLGKAMRDVYTSTPEIQREMAELAVIGAGRAEARHQGLVTEGLKKLGVSEEAAQKADPNYYTSRLIKFMDKSGRLAANRMFDNLVERGMAVDDEANRREFINRMGQYNERLMTQTQQRARDVGLSPFVTAGRTFNRLAMQRLLQSPGYRAQNPVAAAKARLVETIGTASVMFALPIAWNLAHTGSAFPKGIPNAGALALKKNDDGTWEYMDLLQGNLMRRGLRITGLQAMEKDMKLGDSASRTTLDMGKAIVEGVLNPWEGPALRAAKVGMTGKDFSGFLASRNPDNTWENAKAALMNLNPTVATLFGDESKGVKNTVSRLAQVGGLKSGTKGTFEEQADAKANELYKKPYSALSNREKANVSKALEDTKQPPNELAERASGERAYWSGIQRKDDLVAAIPQDVNKFISDNKLKLPGFDEVRTIDKERVPLTNSERKQFEAVVAQKYEAQVRRFMSNPDFVNRTQPSKQAAFDKGMALARRQAWAAFRRSGSQATQTSQP